MNDYHKVSIIIVNFCGKKLLEKCLNSLYKTDYKRMRWGLDKWGDFDLLFGAVKMGNKIMEVPVHYRSRKSGQSKMKTIRHALQLLKATYLGFRDLVILRDRVDSK